MIKIIFYCKSDCPMNEETVKTESIDTLKNNDICPLCNEEIVWDVVHEWESETEEVCCDD